MTKLQTIKRKNGNVTNFMYFPKGELQEAGFKQDEELIIEAKPGQIIISNSLIGTGRTQKNGTEKKQDISALDNMSILGAVREFGEPIDIQKELAIQVKNFLDHQIRRELNERGYLSDATRRWVAELGEILNKIQKALYGEKSVNLHMHKISHAYIGMMMRKATQNNHE